MEGKKDEDLGWVRVCCDRIYEEFRAFRDQLLKLKSLLFSRLGIRRNGLAFSFGVHDPSVLHL